MNINFDKSAFEKLSKKKGNVNIGFVLWLGLNVWGKIVNDLCMWIWGNITWYFYT